MKNDGAPEGRRLSGFKFDASRVRERLFDPEVLAVLKTFPEGVLNFFLDRLSDMLTSGNFDSTPSSDNGSAGIALDNCGFVRIVWDGDVVAATLAAAKRYRDIKAVQERASFSNSRV